MQVPVGTRQLCAGGGGYGDPLKRPIERVAEDVREGYVSAAHAREVYGVVLAADRSLEPSY